MVVLYGLYSGYIDFFFGPPIGLLPFSCLPTSQGCKTQLLSWKYPLEKTTYTANDNTMIKVMMITSRQGAYTLTLESTPL